MKTERDSGHSWRLILGKGDDSPGNSLDEVYWCEHCGLLKHDYRHGGGLRSPNFPAYHTPISTHRDECRAKAQVEELTRKLEATEALSRPPEPIPADVLASAVRTLRWYDDCLKHNVALTDFENGNGLMAAYIAETARKGEK